MDDFGAASAAEAAVGTRKRSARLLDCFPPASHLALVDQSPENPRIQRLTQFDIAMARLLALAPMVDAKECPVGQAAGKILAADLLASASLPAVPIAYIDGWAIRAEDLVGSGTYGGALLTPRWVNAGDPMQDADAVLPPEALSIIATDLAEATGSVAPGEGVRAAGQDIAEGAPVLRTGTRLTPRHLGILRTCGIDRVQVRAPTVRLVAASASAAVLTGMIGGWLEAAGAELEDVSTGPVGRDGLRACYERLGVDLVISLGGTGQGHGDFAVRALMDAGSLDLHGIALRPGASAGFGQVRGIPVLLLPGRIDALLAAFLTLARPALAHMYGAASGEPSTPLPLSDKVSSVIGLHEVFLGLPAAGMVRPLALSEAGPVAVAEATGWFVVPPNSEGRAAGDVVQLQPF